MTRPRYTTLLLLTMTLALVMAAAACGGGAAPAPTAAPAKPAATTAPAAPAGTTAPAAPAATKPAAPAPTTAAAPAAVAVPALTKTYKMSMATGGTAGTYYPFGGAMAGLWSNNLPTVSVTAETTGASVENMRLLANKQVELALTQNDIADYAINGTEMFKDNKITNFKAVAALYPELVQWTVTKDIKTLADLKGKRFVVGPAASGSEANTRQIIEANGMSYKDLGKTLYLSNAEGVAAMKDRQVDGFAITGGVPTSAITDAATSLDISMMAIDGAVAKATMDKYKFFVTAKIPSGAYKGVTADVPTIAVTSVLVARDDLDTDLVYWLTKTLIEKQADLAQAHAKGKDLSKASAITGFTIPFHPGAEKYYREIGLIK